MPVSSMIQWSGNRERPSQWLPSSRSNTASASIQARSGSAGFQIACAQGRDSVTSPKRSSLRP